MAKPRTVEQWDALDSVYRARLIRNGVTREDYLSGASLQKARGQSRENMHSRQRALVRKYGPTNVYGEPIITAASLRAYRKKFGDEELTRRLVQLGADYDRYADTGEDIYPDNPDYTAKADKKRNPHAAFYWYHGLFGTDF